MSPEKNTTVKMYGCLHTIRRERGLEPRAEVAVPPEGCTAEQIAVELDLPLEKIEGVFVNHFVYPLDKTVMPGDNVAFVPTGVPGPHRFMLGIHAAGKHEDE